MQFVYAQVIEDLGVAFLAVRCELAFACVRISATFFFVRETRWQLYVVNKIRPMLRACACVPRKYQQFLIVDLTILGAYWGNSIIIISQHQEKMHARTHNYPISA